METGISKKPINKARHFIHIDFAEEKIHANESALWRAARSPVIWVGGASIGIGLAATFGAVANCLTLPRADVDTVEHTHPAPAHKPIA